MKKHKKTLEEKLHEIYYNTVNLDTTCKGVCECCNVACPSMFYSEFSNLISKIWEQTSKSEKIEMICKSIEYYFKNKFEQYGKEIFIKPCLLLKDGKCKWYEQRGINCRLYGLWSDESYNQRVDRFEKAYSEFGLKREDLPLYKQCKNVKRIDESKPINDEVISQLYSRLDELDKKVGSFSEAQVKNRENYRTFSDWLLFKILGEAWLVGMTDFILSANKEQIDDLIKQIQIAVTDKFSKDMPRL